MFWSWTGRCAPGASRGGTKQAPKRKRRFLLEGKDVVDSVQGGRLLRPIISCLAGVPQYDREPLLLRSFPVCQSASSDSHTPPQALQVRAYLSLSGLPRSQCWPLWPCWPSSQFPAIPGRVRAPNHSGVHVVCTRLFLATWQHGSLGKSPDLFSDQPLHSVNHFLHLAVNSIQPVPLTHPLRLCLSPSADHGLDRDKVMNGQAGCHNINVLSRFLTRLSLQIFQGQLCQGMDLVCSAPAYVPVRHLISRPGLGGQRD